MHPSSVPLPELIATAGPVVAATAVGVIAIVVVLVLRARGSVDPGVDPPRLGATVLVPISRPRSATNLVDLAAAIAVPDRGRLIAMKVLAEDAGDEGRTAAGVLLQQAEVACADAGCDAEEVLRVAGSVAEGVLHAAVERDATLVLCGWPSADREDAWLGRPVGRIVADSPVPIIVARLDGLDWRRVVLADRPSADARGAAASSLLAAEVARRVADARDLRLERSADPVVDPTALVVRGVAPDTVVLTGALRDSGAAGDVLFALSHGPGAEDRRPLLPASEDLERGSLGSGER